MPVRRGRERSKRAKPRSAVSTASLLDGGTLDGPFQAVGRGGGEGGEAKDQDDRAEGEGGSEGLPREDARLSRHQEETGQQAFAHADGQVDGLHRREEVAHVERADARERDFGADGQRAELQGDHRFSLPIFVNAAPKEVEESPHIVAPTAVDTKAVSMCMADSFQ